MNKALSILGLVVLSIAITIYSGFVMKILWGWFVVTTFDLPALTVPIAAGLSLVASGLVITSRPVVDKDAEWRMEMVNSLAFVIAFRTLSLISGWIIYQFV